MDLSIWYSTSTSNATISTYIQRCVRFALGLVALFIYACFGVVLGLHIVCNANANLTQGLYIKSPCINPFTAMAHYSG